MAQIAVIPGDGIGPEVMEQAIAVLERVNALFQTDLSFSYALAGGAAWEKYRDHLPEETIELCRSCDAILFGSVGGPVMEQSHIKWKNVERNALLGLRKEFSLYANIRPVRLFPTLAYSSVLRKDIAEKGIDLVVVRELTGGIYFGDPKGRSGRGHKESAYDTMRYSRSEIERIARQAFKIAEKRRKKVTSADKANVLETMVFWREVVDSISAEFPEIEYEHMYVDNAAMQLLKNPSQFDVILCGNLFGDILSDESAALAGSLGMLPSASLGRGGFGMYEPGGGSAPDIAGTGTANPVAQILSAAMMLRYSCARPDAAEAVERAVEVTMEQGFRTPDIWNDGCITVNTKEMGARITGNLE